MREIVRDQDGEIKILLEGGRNFWQIRDLMGQLNENMNIIEDSATQSNKGAIVVKEVMTHLEFLFTSSMEHTEKQKRKAEKKKNEKNIENSSHVADQALISQRHFFNQNLNSKGFQENNIS